MNDVIDFGFPSSTCYIYEHVVATFPMYLLLRSFKTQRDAQIIFLHNKCIILLSQLYSPDPVTAKLGVENQDGLMNNRA